MIRRMERKVSGGTGRGESRFLRTAIRSLAMLVMLAVFIPFSGYRAKAETEDFLIYVEQVYNITGRGAVISGRVSSGQVNVGDKLTHAGHTSAGAVMNAQVTVDALAMFRKEQSYVTKGDNVEICLGSYDASRIHVGDALISDTRSHYKNYQGLVCGSLTGDDILIDRNETITLKKGEFTITAKSLGYVYYNNDGKNPMYITDQNTAHVYSIGESFAVIQNGETIGTYTVAEVTDTGAKAMVDERAESVGAISPDPGSFRNGSGYNWRAASDQSGRVYAKCGNSDIAASTSTIIYNANFSFPTTVYFKYCANIEGGDTCSFSIDGVEKFSFTKKDSDWQTYVCKLDAGSHKLEWKYVKDTSENMDNDFFGVEGLEFFPANEITFDARGGMFPTSRKSTRVEYTYFGFRTELEGENASEHPIRKGYRFCGYSTDPTPGKGEYVKDLRWEKSGSSRTYYAIWEKEEYNVGVAYSFEYDGWTYVDADGDGVDWMGAINIPWNDLYGNVKKASYSWLFDPDWEMNERDGCYDLLSPDNWMISPGYRIKKLKYSLKFRAENDETFTVYCGTTKDISKMKKIKEIPAGGSKEYSIALDGYEDQTIYVAFRHYNKNGKKIIEDNGVQISDVRFIYEFADVRGNIDPTKNPYYYDPVYWAAQNGITGGVKDADGVARNFNPQGVCNRAQMVSFLWRMAGCPEPTKYTSYKDVKKTDYFYKAVSWAQERGITGGYTDGTFRPNNACSRGQAVTFLYRMAGQPKVTGGSSFKDVKPGTYYHNAVIWASQNGITGGYSDGTFKPDGQCTRAQMVTFLYRYDFNKLL